MVPSRTQITLDPDLDRKAKLRARDLGISFAEYVRRVIARDLADISPGEGIAGMIGIGDSGGSDIGADKDDYINEAFGA